MTWLFQIEPPCPPSPVRGRRGAARRVRALFKGLSLAGHANRNPLTQAGDGPQKAQTQATRHGDRIAVSLNDKGTNHPQIAPPRRVRGDRNGIEFIESLDGGPAVLTIAAPSALGAAVPAAAGTLETVQARGVVGCAVSSGVVGFSFSYERGEWIGLDVDLCGGLAAAILGEADVLSRNTTWTMTRGTTNGFLFVGVDNNDGQGFVVPKFQGLKSAWDLGGTRNCVHGLNRLWKEADLQ
jgi:hypothetical protein